MCGISVIIRTDDRQVSRDDLARMSSAIQHRGPDEAGYSLLDHGRVGFAHVRLSIVDLQTGQQPMFDDEGRLCIVFNGEIYDCDGLRDDLIRQGETFATRSDTEVILKLYKRKGLEGLSQLNGEFAFMIWDGRRKRVIAARDYAGVKPLYLHKNKDEILFCSEAKGLFALPRVPRRISKSYLTGPLLGAFPRAASAFDDIICLRPGHALVIEQDGRMWEHAFWQQKYDVDHSIDFETAKELVRDGVDKAVKRRLVADVPVHCYLSGGLDSSIVCSRIAATGRPFKAYTIAFSNSVYDESELAGRIAGHFGAEFHRLECSMELLSENFERTVYHTENMVANPGAIAKMLLSGLVHAQGEKVCLTGEGADEVFGGYPYFKMEMLWRMQLEGGARARQAKQLWKKFLKLETRSEGIHWNRNSKWKKIDPIFGYPSFLQTRAEEYGALLPRLLNKESLGLTPEDNPGSLFRSQFDAEFLRSLDPINASREMTFNQLYGYMIPNLADRVEMANSVECRTPFLDRELLETAGRLKPEYLLHIDSLREKYVLHEAFQNDLPRFQRGVHKHPFMSPNWYRLSQTPRGKEIFANYLSDSAIRQAGMFNPQFLKNIQRLWTILPDSWNLRKRLDSLIGVVLSMQVLHALLIDRGVASNPSFPMVERKPGVD